MVGGATACDVPRLSGMDYPDSRVRDTVFQPRGMVMAPVLVLDEGHNHRGDARSGLVTRSAEPALAVPEAPGGPALAAAGCRATHRS